MKYKVDFNESYCKMKRFKSISVEGRLDLGTKVYYMDNEGDASTEIEYEGEIKNIYFNLNTNIMHMETFID